jgi:hypothetical protein
MTRTDGSVTSPRRLPGVHDHKAAIKKLRLTQLKHPDCEIEIEGIAQIEDVGKTVIKWSVKPTTTKLHS